MGRGGNLKENRLRNLMKKGEPTLGTRINVIWPGMTELLGYTGMYDYVEFLGEYAPYTLYDLGNLARAAELVGISTMIKVDQDTRTFIAERALAAGIQNLLFADIRTVEDAEAAVRAVRAEPKGINGVRMDRINGYVGATASLAEVVQMYDEAVVAIMVEKKPTIENLEEILSVDGIDMVQFGPSDYSVSLGIPGEKTHPKVKEAELKTIKTALRMDIAPRVEINHPDEAKPYMELGVRDFNLNTDLKILYQWWTENGRALKDILANG